MASIDRKDYEEIIGGIKGSAMETSADADELCDDIMWGSDNESYLENIHSMALGLVADSQSLLEALGRDFSNA